MSDEIISRFYYIMSSGIWLHYLPWNVIALPPWKWSVYFLLYPQFLMSSLSLQCYIKQTVLYLVKFWNVDSTWLYFELNFAWCLKRRVLIFYRAKVDTVLPNVIYLLVVLFVYDNLMVLYFHFMTQTLYFVCSFIIYTFLHGYL